MKITLELELILDYIVEHHEAEDAKWNTFHWKSIKAISPKEDAKISDSIELVNFLSKAEFEEIECNLEEEMRNE